MSKNTKERVLDAITSHGSISTWYAFTQLGNTRLAATIFSLKKDGHVITSEMVKGTNKFQDEVSFARYTYVGKNLV
jgi:hypothetical protein